MKLSLKKTPMINGEHEEHRSPPLSELPLTWGNLPRYPLLALIRFYQLTLSRTLPKDTCRFYPTCSHYGYQAIFKFGVFKGGWMAVTRIVRCNPFNEGGIDPVK